MEKNFNEQVSFYYQKKKNGMDFSQIRKELREKQTDEETINRIVREIDRQILEGDVKKTTKLKAKELRLIGWTLMIIGGGITLGTYFQWLNVKGYYFVTYGPVIIGYLLLIAARKAQRKTS